MLQVRNSNKKLMASEEKSKLAAMYRRWAYMAVAILATALLTVGPLFSFYSDQGVIFVRTGTINQHEFAILQTEIENGITHVTETMSVEGLYYCYIAMLIGGIVTILCFYHAEARLWACLFTIAAAAGYYICGIYYYMMITNTFFPTIAPTWIAILPAVVIEMMVLTRKNVLTYGNYLDEISD